jgi:hypothetical protein
MAIFEIFYAPGKLFASLENRKAVWLAPLLLGALFLALTTWGVLHYIGMETVMRQQLESTRLTPEQMQVAMNRANSPGQVYATYAGTVIVGILSVLLIAGLLTVFALMGSKEPKFGTNFSAVALALFPYRVVICLMTLLVLVASPDRTTLDVTNLLATNVGAFMNKETTSKSLYTLLSQLDVLSFVEIGLMSYGFSKVNRTSLGFGLFSVISLWLIYVFIRVGVSALF